MLHSRLIALSISLSVSLSLSGCGAGPGEHAETDQAPLAQQSTGDPGVIEGVDYFGEGCAGSATTGISPDGQAVTSIFSDLTAATGSGIEKSQAQRSCLMQVRVGVPAGWSYTLQTVDVRGFVALDKGISARRTSHYIVPGNAAARGVGNRWSPNGHEADDWQVADIDERGVGWSPCGRGGRSWIATELSVNDADNGGANGQATIDTVDVVVGWKRCR